jgi:hypothetical protein
MRDTLNQERLPFEPLRPYVPRPAIYPENWRRLLERAKESGYISAGKADDFSCKWLGIHPSAFWPEVFS